MGYNKSGWILDDKRVAIYIRGGFQCVYCQYKIGEMRTYMSGGTMVTKALRLNIDHVKAVEEGGTNHESNLVVACSWCNSSKNDRPLKQFLSELETGKKIYQGKEEVGCWDGELKDSKDITRRINNESKRSLKKPRATAKIMLKNHGKNYIKIAKELGYIE